MANYQTADGPLGRRLIPHIIDKNATAKPDVECFQIPRSAEPRDGWEVITWKQFARAIDIIAHCIVNECGLVKNGKFPTIAYIGLNDARYVVSGSLLIFQASSTEVWHRHSSSLLSRRATRLVKIALEGEKVN